MKVLENQSLKAYNTFGIEANASLFLEIKSTEDLVAFLKTNTLGTPFVLSGGSNMLLTTDVDQLVLYINSKGFDEVYEDAGTVHLKVAAGEVWHDLVCHTLEAGYGGLENLSLIPGKTGTAPIQNIGAYGVELKDVFVSCEAVEIATGEIRVFGKEECQFGYRDSIFKNEAKGRYIICSVTLCLTKKDHTINTSYGAISAELKEMGITNPDPQSVSEAVIAIRKRKLPDPSELGNSGSFFKNPVIEGQQYEKLLDKFPNLPAYPLADGRVKVAAGWLIEQCGFKGFRAQDAGVHKNQALVLVNYGQASGKEILDLAQSIQQKVAEVFDIELQAEVNIIGKR